MKTKPDPRAWQKEIPVDEIREGKTYFMAIKYGQGGLWLWSQPKKGKATWTGKPGIAIQFHGGAALKAAIEANKAKAVFALEVPPDHAKRWKARK